ALLPPLSLRPWHSLHLGCVRLEEGVGLKDDCHRLILLSLFIYIILLIASIDYGVAALAGVYNNVSGLAMVKASHSGH
ncbi:MAG: hypothetical protein RXR09_06830, partial [Acidilobus sp.]